jgi:hypothetical protein
MCSEIGSPPVPSGLAGPPAEGDLVVDQFIELKVGGVLTRAAVTVVLVLVLVLVVVVLVPPVAVGWQGVPGLLHLGECQHRLAPGLLRRSAHQRRPLRVGALEPAPVQAPLGVLVVE